MEPLFIIVVIGIVIALAIAGAAAAARRKRELAEFASARGLTTEAGNDHSFDGRYPDFPCLRRGSRRYAFNVMRGPWNGRRVCAFDYHYETYSTTSKGGRQTHHHYFSAVILESGTPLRPLVIRPENMFDKVTEFFGFDDIDFELDEFSRKFFVKSQDKRWAYDLIHQETMEFLLRSPRFHIEMRGPLVLATLNRRFAAAEFASAIGVIEGILERMPRSLLGQTGS